MSRIGRQPLVIPENVSIDIGQEMVTVHGPKGQLTVSIPSPIVVSVKTAQGREGAGDKLPQAKLDTAAVNGNTLHVKPATKIHPAERGKKETALYGLIRALLANAVQGVTTGFTKQLELVGVGHRAKVENKTLVLSIGYSHPVKIHPPVGIEFSVTENTQIAVHGVDKQTVGEFAARIRRIRLPEPYKGKGIRYKGEVIRRKPGKAAKIAGSTQ